MWKKKVISLLMSVILVIGCVFASELDVKAITRSEVTSQLNSLIGPFLSNSLAEFKFSCPGSRMPIVCAFGFVIL